MDKIYWNKLPIEVKQKYEGYIFKDVYGEDELPELTQEDLDFLGTIDFSKPKDNINES